MNPLTQIKNTQKASQQEIARGVGDSASWHARFKHSAYIFTGGLSYDLTEGDLLAVFSQYGEIVDVNLVRDKDTGDSAALYCPPPPFLKIGWHYGPANTLPLQLRRAIAPRLCHVLGKQSVCAQFTAQPRDWQSTLPAASSRSSTC